MVETCNIFHYLWNLFSSLWKNQHSKDTPFKKQLKDPREWIQVLMHLMNIVLSQKAISRVDVNGIKRMWLSLGWHLQSRKQKEKIFLKMKSILYKLGRWKHWDHIYWCILFYISPLSQHITKSTNHIWRKAVTSHDFQPHFHTQCSLQEFWIVFLTSIVLD